MKISETPYFPQIDRIQEILKMLWHELFPKHFWLATGSKPIRKTITQALTEQINCAMHAAGSKNTKPTEASPEKLIPLFFNTLDHVRSMLILDAQAANSHDPAAKNLDEIILCYPGFLSLMTHRLAHELFKLNIPLVPRMMSEIAHSLTGCDIHPGATIGESFFIDHATGVVIGETAVIGKRVTLFQGVTLGAVVMQKGSSKQRHPTLEDDVVVYANATILGGDTVIGKRSVIGGSCWITFSVLPDTKVILANPRSLVTQSQKQIEYVASWDI